MLEAQGGLIDAEVADFYAGSGSFGIEALSRGAARVTFVERNRMAARTLQANIDQLGFSEQATVMTAPVATVINRIGRESTSRSATPRTPTTPGRICSTR